MRRLPTRITATMIRDMLLCEHRFHLDHAGDPAAKDPGNRFTRMLWENGARHAADVLDDLAGPVADLRGTPIEERVAETERAVAAFAPIILGARIAAADLLGMPDVLRLDPLLGYVAGEVRGGAGGDGGDRPRLDHGVQLAHHGMILARLRWGTDRIGFVLDASGREVAHDLAAPLGSTGFTIASRHAELLARARLVRNGALATTPAASAGCARCHWRTHCRAALEGADAPTLIAQVGRTLREELAPTLPTVSAIAGMSIERHLDSAGRSTIPGIGAGRLARLRDRAVLLRDPGAQAFARRPLDLPPHAHEIHYDIEGDPLRGGVVHLHGMAERVHGGDGATTTFTPFLAEGPAGEGEAFAAAWAFLAARPRAHLYVWSRLARTSMRALQRRHPHVCTAAEVEELFDPARATDLHTDVVLPSTDWPLTGYGLDEIARHVGFEWRDGDRGGAGGVAQLSEWLETGDPAVRDRIVRRSGDHVRASIAVLDALRRLPVRR